MTKTSLVIEGGGMRGFFTCGVLQCLLDHNIKIPYVIGISSGALNAVGYVNNCSSLFFEAIDQFTGRFFNLKNIFHLNGGLLSTDSFFNPCEDQFTKIKENQVTLKIGATRARDGQMIYFDKEEFTSPKDMYLKIKASATLPVLMSQTIIDNEVFVDGGLVDSIPFAKAKEDGCKKHLVIVTRPKGYRKGRQKIYYLLRKWLKPYPLLEHALRTRHMRYNKALEELEALEAKGEALVIRPIINRVGRTEFNPSRLRETYRDGYNMAKEQIETIRHFLEEPILLGSPVTQEARPGYLMGIATKEVAFFQVAD